MERFRNVGICQITYQKYSDRYRFNLTIPMDEYRIAEYTMETIFKIKEDYDFEEVDFYSTDEFDSNTAESTYTLTVNFYFKEEIDISINDLEDNLDSLALYNHIHKQIDKGFEKMDCISIDNAKDNKYSLLNTNNIYMKRKNEIFTNNKTNPSYLMWLKGITTSTSFKTNVKGEKKPYNAYFVYVPKELDEAVGFEDEIYFYEYFDKICLSKTEPPNTMCYKKTKLLRVSMKENMSSVRRTNLPKKYWKITPYSLVSITLHDKKDYIYPQYPLITIDVIENQNTLPENEFDELISEIVTKMEQKGLINLTIDLEREKVENALKQNLIQIITLNSLTKQIKLDKSESELKIKQILGKIK